MEDAKILREEATFPDGLWWFYLSGDTGRCHRKDASTACKGSSSNTIAMEIVTGMRGNIYEEGG